MQSLTAAFEPAEHAHALADDEIHVWLLALEAGSSHRDVGAAGHALLERLLMRYARLDRAPPIDRTEHGKPYAPTLPELDFNLSHAGNHVLIAVTRRQQIGVDIERVERHIEVERLSRRFYAAAEADALASLPVPARLAAFLRLWTCKEAVLKALGVGLSFGLHRVAFELDPDGIPHRLAGWADEAGRRENWHVAVLEPAEGYLGAIAWQGPPRRVRLFRADRFANA